MSYLESRTLRVRSLSSLKSQTLRVCSSLLSPKESVTCQTVSTQAGRDSNPQPLVLETSALPIELPTFEPGLENQGD